MRTISCHGKQIICQTRNAGADQNVAAMQKDWLGRSEGAEIIFEIEDSDIHRYGDKISDLMGSAEKLSVPLLVNTFSGSNWQET